MSLFSHLLHLPLAHLPQHVNAAVVRLTGRARPVSREDRPVAPLPNLGHIDDYLQARRILAGYRRWLIELVDSGTELPHLKPHHARALQRLLARIPARLLSPAGRDSCRAATQWLRQRCDVRGPVAATCLTPLRLDQLELAIEAAMEVLTVRDPAGRRLINADEAMQLVRLRMGAGTPAPAIELRKAR